MTRDITLRTVYIRITNAKGKREYLNIGWMNVGGPKNLLKKHPQLILGKPREGTNPKYDGNQKWSSYGDYWFGHIRKRRGD